MESFMLHRVPDGMIFSILFDFQRFIYLILSLKVLFIYVHS